MLDNSLSLFLEVTGSLKDDEAETEENTNPPTINSYGELSFEKTYYKTISFTADETVQFANQDKLPFNITPPTCTTSITITKGNPKHKKANSLVGNVQMDKEGNANANITNDNKLKLTATYYAQAGGYESKAQITGKKLKPYYTANTSDADFIFGYD